jgi:hypothetical protein
MAAWQDPPDARHEFHHSNGELHARLLDIPVLFLWNLRRADLPSIHDFQQRDFASTQSDALHVAGSFEGTLDMLTGADGKVRGSVQLNASAIASVIAETASATAFID